ncbi:MAG: anhydro-N-acetylmuramic acid kinase [Gammaproteobacteria bacterium]|uniref:Anhydro-N-acetylmuramic acid kinase n=1 Tax=Candidatus Thiopontia autotrophica TaxID=2841688 RepID=A0A8J6P3D5_9GAMM|nr:anhydro-N-acetylmuramic acid kinase [Candidatus Thiopontia autotrophica]MBL6968813.1 anhydro-N-acetylmuramic acid kinase [Gammaproteobacteria bacterium]
MSEYFVGLMSGTSMDGVDAVVVDFSTFPPSLCATDVTQISPSLKERILALCMEGENEIERMGELDVELGVLFSDAAVAVVEKAGLAAEKIVAIGSHGQTIRHKPTGSTPFTLQIGDPNIVAQRTGITTVADFRRRDIAAGGEGAPLAPAYHRWLMRGQSGAVVNIGGMANVTLLPADRGAPVVGFDTGPGNVLMDYWAEESFGTRMDKDGLFARQGELSSSLLKSMLSDPFFSRPSPKSTGRELFNSDWLYGGWSSLVKSLPVEDVAATLCELTAVTVADAVRDQNVGRQQLLVCGGGAHNSFLLERMAVNLSGWSVDSTASIGVDPDWVEAVAFGWLARQTVRGDVGNIPSVTGANQSVILGAIFPVKSA